MITYEIEGHFPVRFSTVEIFFDKVQTISAVKNNLFFQYGDKIVNPYQAGDELVWDVTDSEGESLFEMHAPYKDEYLSIKIEMPRGTEDEFFWRIPDEDPIVRRDFEGVVKLTVNFSQVVTAGEVESFLKIAGRDCIHVGTDFLWKAEGYDDIVASYEPEFDSLLIRIPNDTIVNTVQWTAAEPIPIEQMYHKPTHMPFYPKTAFAAVVDHNGNTLSQVFPDVVERITVVEPIANVAFDRTVNHEGRIVELEAQFGIGTEFQELKDRVTVTEERLDGHDATITNLEDTVNAVSTDVASHEFRLDNIEAAMDTSKYEKNAEVNALDSASADTKTLYRLKMDNGAYKKGFYAFDGVEFLRLDNVDSEGSAKVKVLTQAEYDALATKDANTFYCIKKSNAAGTITKIVKMYIGEIEFGAVGSALGAMMLGSDTLGD